ncbi:uncharacterized protein LOC144102159 [Amblyomma americanum]
MRAYAEKDPQLAAESNPRWMTAASLATFLLLSIAVTVFFMYAGTPMSAPPPLRFGNPASPDAEFNAPRHRSKWVTYYDSPIKVTPNVLLCATNGRGADRLGDALDTYCTHVIYTGPMAIERSENSGKLYVSIQDSEGYRVFSGLTKNHERFLSFRWKAAIWNEGDVLHALVVYLRYFKLRGVELVMGSHLESTKFIRFCQGFVHRMKNNASLIIRVERTVDLTRGLFERLARQVAHFAA